MAIVCPYLSIITLHINKLNSLIKRYRMAKHIKKRKKNMIQPYAAYKRFTLALKTHTD